MTHIRSKINASFRKAGMTLKDNDFIEIKKNSLGMTNENYECKLSNGEHFVIRFAGKGANCMIDRNEESDNQKLVEELGLNAEVIFFDESLGTKITRYIKNALLDETSILVKIPKVSNCLKRLHNSTIKFNNNFSFSVKIDQYEKVLNQYGAHLCSNFVELKNRAVKLHNQIQSGLDLKPCHNDLVFENFLMDEKLRLYLIDWEYSGMNDPLWDIASFSLENKLTKDEQIYFWDCYFGPHGPTYSMQEHIEFYKICQDLLWFVWAKIKISQGIDLTEYADFRLQRAMGSPILSEVQH